MRKVCITLTDSSPIAKSVGRVKVNNSGAVDDGRFSTDEVMRALQFLLNVALPDDSDQYVFEKDAKEHALYLLDRGDHDMTLEVAQVVREWAGSI